MNAGRQTDRQTETDGQTDRQTDGQAGRQTETDGQTDRHRQTARLADRQRQTARQTDRLKDRFIDRPNGRRTVGSPQHPCDQYNLSFVFVRCTTRPKSAPSDDVARTDHESNACQLHQRRLIADKCYRDAIFADSADQRLTVDATTLKTDSESISPPSSLALSLSLSLYPQHGLRILLPKISDNTVHQGSDAPHSRDQLH